MAGTKVKNLGRLNKKLARLSQSAIEAIRPALADAADEIVAMAKRFAPVSSGRLRDSIGWTWGNEIPKGSTSLGTVRGKAPELTITIYAGDDKAFYARWVEFGTPTRRAQPFFFPAYRASRKSAKAKVKRAVRKAAKKEAGVS